MDLAGMDIIRQIQIFGDSIMKGILFDKDSDRYYPLPNINMNDFAKRFSLGIENKSRFGCTIQKGWVQLKRALDMGLGCDAILLEYGGNDCDFKWEEVAAAPEAEHQPNTPYNTFVDTLRNMTRELKAHHITPIMMSLPPIDAERYFSWITRKGLSREAILSWLGDISAIYRHQELYSNAIAKVARETRSLFVDVRSSFLARRDFKSLICEDGIHPSEEGHKLIFEAFSDFARLNLKRERNLLTEV